MAFDLTLIERALDQAVCDAEDALAERHRDYAGYPGVGKFALYEDAVRDAKAARAEFARLRKAMESATEPQRVTLDCIVHVTVSESWRGDRVLLVKADD